MLVLSRIRIPISGDLVGILIVIGAPLLVVSLITWLMEVVVSSALFKNSDKARKVINIVKFILYAIAIILIILDLTDIYPLIRQIIFSLIG